MCDRDIPRDKYPADCYRSHSDSSAAGERIDHRRGQIQAAAILQCPNVCSKRRIVHTQIFYRRESLPDPYRMNPLYLGRGNNINRHKPLVRSLIDIPTPCHESCYNARCNTGSNFRSGYCSKRYNRLRLCKVIHNFRGNVLLHAARLLNNNRFFHCNSRMTSMMSSCKTVRSTS